MEFYGLSLYDIFILALIIVTNLMILSMGVSLIMGIKIIAVSARNLLIAAILQAAMVVISINEVKTVPVAMMAMLIILIYGYWYRTKEKKNFVDDPGANDIFLEEAKWKAETFGTDKK